MFVMFFRLLPEVYLVIGKQKSLLQNISNGRIFWIDNPIAQLIKLCENNHPIESEFFDYACALEKDGWGTITERPIFLEKLRLVNVIDERQMHQKAPNISQATLKITNRCNLQCDSCGKIFCPSCIKEKSEQDMPLQLIENILNKLKTYRCKTILLTGGEIALVPNLGEIYKLLNKTGFNVTLNTNGIKKLDNYFIDANILISIFSKENVNNIINNYIDFKNITILKYFEDIEESVFPNTWTLINRATQKHKITKKSLLNTSIDRFHLRQNRNTCLDGKIVINQDGDVYPCLESIKLNKVVGNVNSDDWEVIVQKLEKNFWENKIDEHKICKNCEFRYACNSCIFDNVKENCCYDMELGLWK